jgi:hypothetical protein
MECTLPSVDRLGKPFVTLICGKHDLASQIQNTRGRNFYKIYFQNYVTCKIKLEYLFKFIFVILFVP